MDNVFPKLVRGDDYVEGFVHFYFLDLVVKFYVLIDKRYDGGISSYLVTDALLNTIGLSADDIYRYALRNLSLNVRIAPLNELLEHAGIEAEGFVPMLIVSTPNNYYGAACMMIDGVRETLGSILGEPFIILPSSIHEIIAVPSKMIEDLNVYADMVYHINRTQLEEREFLSDSVYISENGAIDVYRRK